MEDDLPGSLARMKWLKQALVVFALIIIPYILTVFRAAKADNVSPMITGTTKALHLVIALQALLPFMGKKLPFRGVVTSDLLHNWRKQHRLRPVLPTTDSRNLSAISMNELNFQLGQFWGHWPRKTANDTRKLLTDASTKRTVLKAARGSTVFTLEGPQVASLPWNSRQPAAVITQNAALQNRLDQL